MIMNQRLVAVMLLSALVANIGIGKERPAESYRLHVEFRFWRRGHH